MMRNKFAVTLTLALFFTVFCFQAVAEDVLCEPGNAYNYFKRRCYQCSAGSFANGTVPLTYCEKCAPGSISPAGAKECTVCPAGTYESSNALCKPCDEGKVSLEGASGWSSCGVCLPGLYSPDKTAKNCRECPAGTYESDRESCKSCNPGTVSDYGAAKCKACPEGSYAANGQTQCLACPEGTTSQEGSEGIESCGICFPGSISSDGNSKNCRQCAAGTYEVNRSSCQSCPAGTISAKGAGSCKPCRVGSYANWGGTECTECPAGTWDVNRTKCEKCPAGTFSEEMKNDKCTACPAGSIASSPGSASCVECPAGTWEANKTSCETCPAGTFSQAGKNDKCTACPAGFIAPSPGSTSCTTKCQPGFRAFNGVSCLRCGPGTFGTDGIECRQCPNGTISNVYGESCTPCQPGYVSVKGNTECQEEKKPEEEKKSEEEQKPQEPAIKDDGSSGSSGRFMILKVLGVGIIIALVFVGVYLRKRKPQNYHEDERSVRMSLIDQSAL